MPEQRKNGFYQRLVKLIYCIEENCVFSSIKKGLLMLIPILVTGSVALMFRSFPVPAFQEFLSYGAGAVLLRIFDLIYHATFGFLSAYLVFGISYYYASALKPGDNSFQILSVFVAFSCFVASFGAVDGAFEMSYFSAVGVFTAMVCSVAGPWLFYLLCSKLPRLFRSYAAGADLRFRTAISMIFPFALCVSAFVLVNFLFSAAFHVNNVNDLLADGMLALFQGIQNDLLGGILFVVLLNLLWIFGIHGGNMMEPVSLSVFVPANADPAQIVSKSFMDNFALMGGCGATLCLLVALLIFSRTRNNRHLARSAAPFAIFNMNEILVFGLPIILNPIMLIPFLLVPVISLLIGYLATVCGFIPVVTETVTWTTPVLFSGYIATGTLQGAIVQLVILAAGVAVYTPFIRLQEKMQLERENILLEELTRYYQRCEKNHEECPLLDRNDELGLIAKSLATQLRSDIKEGRIPVFYQPQMDASSGMVGAEALLRWQYGEKRVYPPLVVALAQEDKQFDRLTETILRQTVGDIQSLCRQTTPGMVVSVNVTASQIDNTKFVDQVILIAEEGRAAANLCLEITEHTNLENYRHITANLERLNAHGISAAIDDFSMGHTSLKYLQNNAFRYVKLDGALVRQVLSNRRSKDIIRSIVLLGNRLGFEVVAEYVENETLHRELLQLGCCYFQGYYYSPAIPMDELIAYCQEREKDL